MNEVLGKIIKKSTAVFFTIILTAGCSFASNINLSEIEITADSQNNYQINLKTDKHVDFKQKINGNKLTINLKNTKTTADFTTSYKNAPGINNVLVTTAGTNDTEIQIQGENILNSQINNEPPVVQLKQAKEFKVGMLPALKKDNSMPAKNNFNPITILGLAVILLTVKRTLDNTKAKNTKLKIDKNSLEREINNAKNLTLRTKELISQRNRIDRNSTIPSIHYTKPQLKNMHLHDLTAIPVKQKTNVSAVPVCAAKPIMQKQVNVDSIKFLESMIKIYEQNGRQDLASNLKNKVTKISI